MVFGPAGMELIFFLAAYITLWMRFIIKTVLTTQKCFSHCTIVFAQCLTMPDPHSAPTVNTLGVCRGFGGDTSRKRDQSEKILHAMNCDTQQ